MNRESREQLLSPFRAPSGGMVDNPRIASVIAVLPCQFARTFPTRVGMWFDTRSTFLTAGAARGPTALNAFDNALRDAKIYDFNLIKVSSILPPGRPVHILTRAMPVVDGRGMMLPAVVSSIESAQTGATISAGVAVGRPTDPERAGVIYKHSGPVPGQDVRGVLEEMVDEALRVQRGVSDYAFLPLIAEAVVGPAFTGVVACLGYCDTVLERVVFGSERVVERAALA